MIEQLRETDFLSRLGTPCRLTVGNFSFDLTIESVSRYSHTIPAETSRNPFTVLLKGPLEPNFQYGTFTLEMQDSPAIDYLYIERVAAPLSEHKHMAYYQIIFT